MTSLYKILKSAKLGAGAAQDFHTAIMAQKMPFAKGSGAEHEYTGAVPVTFTANGQPLLDYLISGNTVQNGTPTPDNPIMPQGTGERTGNLFDVDNAEFGIWVNSNGSISTNATYGAGYDIKVGTALEFAIKYYGDKPYSYSMAFYDTNGNFLSRVHWANPSASYNTFPVPENAVSARFQVAVNTSIVMTPAMLKAMKLMLNTGSTALPYEPYGYKIPISSANTTTPVYLGEVETMRKIKKLVLTGSDDEDWSMTTIGTNDYIYRMELSDLPKSGVTPICTHYTGSTATRWVDVANYEVTTSIINSVAIRHRELTGVSAWKSYLAAQYAAGTPVTVWYVLAEPTTGIVNEPLMKIGSYTDSISMEQAGVEIPTARGTNTLDVLTDVKPSEVYIKYKS